MSIVVRLSHFCVHFSEKFDCLLDRLDNRRMMHSNGSAGTKMTPITIAV
jgi:hypothetical protein